MRSVASILLSCLALLVLAPRSARGDSAQQRETLTAKQILAHTAKTYARCKSYQDGGSISTISVHTLTGRRRRAVNSFNTVFVRPDRFRFEYGGGSDHCIVWRQGTEMRGLGLKEVGSFAAAMVEANEVSGGIARLIPALLLPEEVGGWCLSEMTEARRIEDASLGMEECFRIEGKCDTGFPTTVWIAKQTFLVRQIDRTHMTSDYRVEMKIVYRGLIVNEAVPEFRLKLFPFQD